MTSSKSRKMARSEKMAVLPGYALLALGTSTSYGLSPDRPFLCIEGYYWPLWDPARPDTSVVISTTTLPITGGTQTQARTI